MRCLWCLWLAAYGWWLAAHAKVEGNAEATSAPALKDEFLDMRAHLLLVSSHMLPCSFARVVMGHYISTSSTLPLI